MKVAQWICAPQEIGCCPSLRKSIAVEKDLKKAVLRITAMGVYRAYIGGQSVTDGAFMPGWTNYNHFVQEQIYDVTSLCVGKTAEIEVLLGDGWACAEMLGWVAKNRPYAPFPSVRATLTLTYFDGTSQKIVTDESWEVWTSRILYSELYFGEVQDARVVPQKIGQAKKTNAHAKVIRQIGEKIIADETVYPRELIITPKGERVIDFGQNMAGWVRVRIKGNRGDKISFVPAEILDKDGNFYNENYRKASSVCTYTLSGGDDEFMPVFSFQGFRYIRLDEYPDKEIDLDEFTALALHSDIKRTCRFVCGNEKINQLYSNIVWGQLSNYIDVPTDCPQRDERLGWLGDAQVFCRTAAINFDVEKFFRKWLKDLRADQKEDGSIEGVSPKAGKLGTRISSGWGDALTICPWEIYKAFGNKEILSDSLESMEKWVAYIKSTGDNPYLWNTGNHYGDWLATDAPYGTCVGATDIGLVCTAFYAYSVDLVIRARETLGMDASEYKVLRKEIGKAFALEYTENGFPKGEPAILGKTEKPTCYTQTALALMLYFGLCREEDKSKLTDALVSLIEQSGKRMSTGFLGTPYILHALSENGRSDIAYDLLLQEKAPSWLFSVNRGATTMWEHWDGIDEEGRIWSKDMNSFNHYAYGAVFDWIFGVSAGIVPVEAGYGKIRIAPKPDKRLGFSDIVFESRKGTIRAAWRYTIDSVRFEYEIPADIEAEIVLPNGKKYAVKGGKHIFSIPAFKK